VPDEAVAALREAGEQIAQDDEFSQEAEEILGPYELMVGDAPHQTRQHSECNFVRPVQVFDDYHHLP
jgi:hypothetical protein